MKDKLMELAVALAKECSESDKDSRIRVATVRFFIKKMLAILDADGDGWVCVPVEPSKPDAGVVTEEDVEIALTITQGPPEPPGSNSLTREFNRPKIRKALESYASRHARQVPDDASLKDSENRDGYVCLKCGHVPTSRELRDGVCKVCNAAPPAPEKD